MAAGFILHLIIAKNFRFSVSISLGKVEGGRVVFVNYKKFKKSVSLLESISIAFNFKHI